jgi:hypothetical protein
MRYQLLSTCSHVTLGITVFKRSISANRVRLTKRRQDCFACYSSTKPRVFSGESFQHADRFSTRDGPPGLYKTRTANGVQEAFMLLPLNLLSVVLRDDGRDTHARPCYQVR